MNHNTRLTEQTPGSLNNHMVATMRLALAASALVILYIDPIEEYPFDLLTHLVLIIYILYSALIFYLETRQDRLAAMVLRWSHWIDIGWYLLLVSFSSGSNSLFFFFFFFCILVASFRWGFDEGLRVTIFSSLSFTTIGYLTAPNEPEFELNRLLLRPVYLCILGYMIAYLGGYEIRLQQRLALLKEVSTIWNPRFGVHRIVGVMMEQLRAFFDADTCVFLIRDRNTGAYRLHHVTRFDTDREGTEKPLDEANAAHLLAIPDQCAVAYSLMKRRLRGERKIYYAYDLAASAATESGRQATEELADLLDALAYVSAPLLIRNQPLGRLFLIKKRHGSFDHTDVEFLVQVVNQITPVIENILLVDRLASEAAEEERKRIARDIHDSIIQPYIGLQMGLASVDRRLSGSDRGGSEVVDQQEIIESVKSQVAKLSEMTEEGVLFLRRYIRGLTEEQRHGEILGDSLQTYAKKFSSATGISVTVETKTMPLNDRLAAELFQIVAEGLSNIRRHTHSDWAAVTLDEKENVIILKIENHRSATCDNFTPSSISQRANSLGGTVQVSLDESTTCVIIEIPL